MLNGKKSHDEKDKYYVTLKTINKTITFSVI